MAYINQRKYYTNDGVVPTDSNWGSYQYVSLDNIMTNFELMYDGNHSLVNNENRYKILFHAKRAIQELNYDACLLYTSPSPRDRTRSRMPSSA